MSVDEGIQKDLLVRVRQLDAISQNLRGIGLNLILYLCLEFAFVPALAIEDKYDLLLIEVYDVSTIIYIVIILLAILAFRSLIRFSKNRTEGFGCYNRIADIIDWENRNKRFLVQSPKEVKESMARFVRFSDLPFSSKENGRIVYLLIFSFLLSAASVIYALSP